MMILVFVVRCCQQRLVLLLGSRGRVLYVTDVTSALHTPDEAAIGGQSEQDHRGWLDINLTVRGVGAD